jgi:hypothetical protein
VLLFEQLAQKLAQKKGDTPGCGGGGDTPVCEGGGEQGTGNVDLPNVFGVRKRAWMEDYGEMPIVAQVCKKILKNKELLRKKTTTWMEDCQVPVVAQVSAKDEKRVTKLCSKKILCKRKTMFETKILSKIQSILKSFSFKRKTIANCQSLPNCER